MCWNGVSPGWWLWLQKVSLLIRQMSLLLLLLLPLYFAEICWECDVGSNGCLLLPLFCLGQNALKWPSAPRLSILKRDSHPPLFGRLMTSGIFSTSPGLIWRRISIVVPDQNSLSIRFNLLNLNLSNYQYFHFSYFLSG